MDTTNSQRSVPNPGNGDGQRGTPRELIHGETLLHQHTAPVERQARRFTGNRVDAEDPTQDVLMRALHALPTHGVINLDAWLRRIATNLFIDRLRRRQRLAFVPLSPQVMNHPDLGAGPEDVVLNSTFAADIQCALDALAPSHLEVLLLRDVAGYTDTEIANALRVPRGTVASRLHRGHAQLRAALPHRAPTALVEVA
jgi:RNA polymerase sigma factor (sigma-70 family)